MVADINSRSPCSKILVLLRTGRFVLFRFDNYLYVAVFCLMMFTGRTGHEQFFSCHIDNECAYSESKSRKTGSIPSSCRKDAFIPPSFAS